MVILGGPFRRICLGGSVSCGLIGVCMLGAVIFSGFFELGFQGWDTGGGWRGDLNLCVF